MILSYADIRQNSNIQTNVSYIIVFFLTHLIYNCINTKTVVLEFHYLNKERIDEDSCRITYFYLYIIIVYYNHAKQNFK